MLIKFSDRFYYTKQRYMYLEPTLGYVKGEYFSVMLDSGNGPAQVETFLKELKENDLPMPSYVILTHHHWDHSFGAAYLDIPVIATDRARDSFNRIISTRMGWWESVSKSQGWNRDKIQCGCYKESIWKSWDKN